MIVFSGSSALIPGFINHITHLLASVALSSWEQAYRLLSFQDHNTRVVLLGTAMLGCAAGIVGVFTLLRKRALMGDAISHATLPGIAISFLIAMHFGWNEKSLPLLLVGATLTGVLGVLAILAVRNLTKIKEDTALGIVLSVFFGAGIALLGIIQQMPLGHAAGLESFIFGKTASMIASDAILISVASLLCLSFCLLFFKELKLLCFDETFAGSRGYPTTTLDLMLMGSVVVISIVGLQAVGLIMVVALLVIPAAAARFWTDKLGSMTAISACIGTLSGICGSALSAIYPRLPSGATIVLFCAGCFTVSLAVGSRRGLIIRSIRRIRMNRSIAGQHFLRTMFELTEDQEASLEQQEISIEKLNFARAWNPRELSDTIRRATNAEWITRIGSQIRLTKKGRIEAERLTREHRLWELFLIHHADFAPSRVDREADHIEHVLEPEIVAELEALLSENQKTIPQSPHLLTHHVAEDELQTRHAEPTHSSGNRE